MAKFDKKAHNKAYYEAHREYFREYYKAYRQKNKKPLTMAQRLANAEKCRKWHQKQRESKDSNDNDYLTQAA